MNNHSEVAKLAYELTYHRYLLNKDMAHDLFTELTVSDYIALHSIAGIASDQPASPERTYLKDLADQLDMPIHSVSNMVRKLYGVSLDDMFAGFDPESIIPEECRASFLKQRRICAGLWQQNNQHPTYGEEIR